MPAARVTSPLSAQVPAISSFNRLRSAIGPIIMANLDPSHFFFQGMDPLAVIRALGTSIGYVHAKDARVDPYNLAVQGALDLQPGKPVRDLVWAYRTLGYGHGAQFWADFVSALRSVGYDGVLSIEHEDPVDGCRRSRVAARSSF